MSTLAVMDDFVSEYGLEFVEELVVAFRASVDECMPVILEAVKHGDEAKRKAACHKLKSGCRNLGANQAGQLCETLEKSVDSSFPATTQVEVLAGACAAFLARCDTWLQTQQAT